MPQEITRTQIEKYTVYTGPTAESFSPIMAGITYPDPAYEILVYRRPLCVFEYVLSGRGHIERNGSILTVNAGDAYILYTLLTSWLYCSINIFRSLRIFWQTKFPSILLHWRSAIISICT